MFNSIVQFLNKPYPMLDFKKVKFKMSLFFGFFVFIFLYVFRPFGIDLYGDKILVVTIGYGLISFVLVLANSILIPYLFPKYLNSDKWTVFRSLILNTWFIFSIGIGNYLYDYYLLPNAVHSYSLFEYLGITLAVGLIPSILLLFVLENKYSTERAEIVSLTNIAIVERSNQQRNKPLIFIGNGSQDELRLMPDNILMINSDGNYCDFHIIENNKYQKKIIRISLKMVEDILGGSKRILKVHRSYIVNLDHIDKISGNARSLIAHITKFSLKAPISRSYEREFTNAIRHI